MDEIPHILMPELENLYSGITPAHGLEHVRRVQQVALYIATGCGLDIVELAVLRVAAILHDVGLAQVEHGQNHAGRSAELVDKQFDDIIICPDQADEDNEGRFRDLIISAIRQHSDFEPDVWGNTASIPVGRILQDSDKIDGMGLCGLFRIASTWLPELSLETLIDPLVRRDITRLVRTEHYARLVQEVNVCIGWTSRMHTQAGKRLALPRVARLIGFREILEGRG